MFVRDFQHPRTQIFLLNQDADLYDDHDDDSDDDHDIDHNDDVDHDDDQGEEVNLEDGLDGAPAGVSPHVNHHGEAKLPHILAAKEI